MRPKAPLLLFFFFHSVLVDVGVDVCAGSISSQNDWRDDDLDGGCAAWFERGCAAKPLTACRQRGRYMYEKFKLLEDNYDGAELWSIWILLDICFRWIGQVDAFGSRPLLTRGSRGGVGWVSTADHSLTESPKR